VRAGVDGSVVDLYPDEYPVDQFFEDVDEFVFAAFLLW
jgi:hypothetical protein